MKVRLTRRGFVALAGGLLLGGAVAGTAFAQQAAGPSWGPGACPMGAGGGPRSGGRPGAGPMGQAGAPHAAIAAALGMNSEDLFTAQRSGKTIAQLAQEKGVDLDTVVKTALEAHDKALDAQVQAGRLTQEQADSMDARMEANVRTMVTQQHGPGSGGGPGSGSGMWPGRRGPGMGPGFGPGWHGQQ